MKKIILALVLFSCTFVPTTQTYAWTKESTKTSIKASAAGAAVLSTIIFTAYSYKQQEKYKNKKEQILALLKKYENIETRKQGEKDLQADSTQRAGDTLVKEEIITMISEVLETITQKKIALSKTKDFFEQKEQLWKASTIISALASGLSALFCAWAITGTIKSQENKAQDLSINPDKSLEYLMREKFNKAFEEEFPGEDREKKEIYKKRINEKFIPIMIRNNAWKSVDNLPLESLLLNYGQNTRD